MPALLHLQRQGKRPKVHAKQKVPRFFFTGCAFYWLVRTLYLVRRLVLRKGGRHVTIVTYGLLGATSKNTTVPLSHVRKFLSIKYLLDIQQCNLDLVQFF